MSLALLPVFEVQLLSLKTRLAFFAPTYYISPALSGLVILCGVPRTTDWCGDKVEVILSQFKAMLIRRSPAAVLVTLRAISGPESVFRDEASETGVVSPQKWVETG